MSSKRKVCVVGMGKAGLPLISVIADSGLRTIGYDIDEEKVSLLNNKKNPIPEEPGVEEILQKHVGKNLSFSTNLTEVASEVDTYIVIVPLFIDDEHQSDFSILDSAFTAVGNVLKEGNLVVLETTVPPGTTEKRIKSLLEKTSGLEAGKNFFLGYSPERIMTGYSISRYKEFPKVVSGYTNKCLEEVYALYSTYCSEVHQASNIRTAELVKVAEGVYRDVNIALANELKKVSESYGVDFWEMREHAKHEYCNILEGGHVGGHCIPVYPWFLINDLSVPLTKTARVLNDEMIQYYADKIRELYAPPGKVGVVGLSYREGVKEIAYTRSIPMINLLQEMGYEVYGIDPMYDAAETKQVFGVEQISDFSSLDSIIVLTKESSYNEELLPLRDRVIDVRHVLE